MLTPIGRRIAGTAVLVGVIALATLGFEWRFARQPGTTEVVLVVNEAGIGTQPGTDVKIRGVVSGEVISVEAGESGADVAHIRVRLHPGVQVPTEELDVRITPKTFFGEKQIELDYPLEAFGEPPFLEEGDLVEVEGSLTEVEDVLVALQPLLDGIDENDLATLFEANAALKGQEDLIARNLEVTAEVARFGVDVSDATLRNARLLTSLADQLTEGADEFDRLNRNLPAAVAILSERQADIETNLDALSSFALTIAAWIDVEEERFDRLLDQNDVVGAFLERNVDSIPSLIEGIRIFAEAQHRPSPYLDDETIYVPFKIFFEFEGVSEGLDELFGSLEAPQEDG